MAMDNVRVLKVDTGEAQTSVKDLKNQLKALKDTLVSTTEGTEEYNTALAQAAEITHTLKEQTEEINASAMDFGQIASNCTKTVGGMVAGFQAAKATLNLFGIENEDVIKSLQKMQSLMAITQALPSIDNGVKAFKRLSLAIKAAAGATNGFKAALISTGIGAAVVAIGALVANFDKLKAAITGSNDELEKQKKLQMDVHLKKVNDELGKRLSLEEEIRKAGGQDDVTIAAERVKSIEKEIKKKEALIEANRREAAQAYIAYTNAMQAGKAQSYVNQLKEKAEAIQAKEEVYLKEIEAIRNNQLKAANEELEIEKKLQAARDIKAKQDAAAKAAEDARKKAEDARKKRIEDEKKAVEELRKKYGELAENIALYDATDYEKDLASLAKAEQKSIKTIEDAQKKGIISKEQYEKDKLAIEKYYIKLRDNAQKEEAQRQREQSIELLDTSYQLEQAKLQKQYDEKLISEKDFTDRKKELMTTYVQDYVDNIQFILDTEEGLTDAQILDLTTKINEAREMLKPQDEVKTEGETLAKGISEAINASALALTDFSDNPAWGNILKNVATLAANWDLLHEQIKKGGKDAFTAYAQIAATALSAVAQMMNGLAAEQDTSNKEGFESAKKYQIAGATMSMLAGIASAWASSMQLMFPANVIVGSLLSAMMLTTGLMQIDKIRKTQFNSKGASGGNSTPNSGAVASVIAPVQYTQDVQGASIEGAIKDSRVYVVESDITDTQEKVSVTENEAKY